MSGGEGRARDDHHVVTQPRFEDERVFGDVQLAPSASGGAGAAGRGRGGGEGGRRRGEGGGQVGKVWLQDDIDAVALVAGLLGRKRERRCLMVGAIGGGVREWEGYAHQEEEEENEEEGEPGAWWYGRRRPLVHLEAGAAATMSV